MTLCFDQIVILNTISKLFSQHSNGVDCSDYGAGGEDVLDVQCWVEEGSVEEVVTEADEEGVEGGAEDGTYCMCVI